MKAERIDVIKCLWGILSWKQEAVDYFRKKKPVMLAGLIVFICAVASTFAVWSVFISFGKTDRYYDLVIVKTFLTTIFQYWIMNSVLFHAAIVIFIKSQNLPKSRVSLKEILSLIGFLCPLYSFTYLAGMLSFFLPNTIQPILLLTILVLWFYMLVAYSNGIAELYQIPKKLPVVLMSIFIIITMPNMPLAIILGYARWP